LSVAFEGPLLAAPFFATVRGTFLAFAAAFLTVGFLTALFLVDFAAAFLATGFLTTFLFALVAVFFAAFFFCSGFLLCLCQGTSPLNYLCHLSAISPRRDYISISVRKTRVIAALCHKFGTHLQHVAILKYSR
tara:strand:+ start:811 stop:1209 length:399 start_codon:yes stop_codon:yes gene_type:complete